MIYYNCALYLEAKNIIAHYSLKRLDVKGRFQFFTSKEEPAEAVLVISGTGAYNATAAVTMLCTLFPPKAGDVFVNFGLCGAFPRQESICPSIGELFLAYCVKDTSGKKAIYPDLDLLIKAPFKKALLKTFDEAVVSTDNFTSEDVGSTEAVLADMEGYGALFAASLFFESHRCFVIKAVSDVIGRSQLPDKKQAEEIVAFDTMKVTGFADNASQAAKQDAKLQSVAELSKSECEAADLLSEKLSLSEAMREQLNCLLKQYRLRGKAVDKIIYRYVNESDLICGLGSVSKRDGKKLFSEFKEYLINND